MPCHGTAFAGAERTYHNITFLFADEVGELDEFRFTHNIRRSKLIAFLQVGWYDPRLRKCILSFSRFRV